MLLEFVKFLIRCFLRLCFRIKVNNKENLPKEGGVIVCFNHRSNWDVPVTSSFLKRKLHFMAKKELFDIFLLGRIIAWSGAFPVSRGKGDIGAIKSAVTNLKEGKAVAMFPEGTRVKKEAEHKAKAGIALIANMADCLVLPVGISGEYRLFSKIDINIGKPYKINPEREKLDADHLQKISDEILHKILLLAEAK